MFWSLFHCPIAFSCILCSTGTDISEPLLTPLSLVILSFLLHIFQPSTLSQMHVSLYSVGLRVLFFPGNILCLPFQRIFSFSEIIIGGLNNDSDLASIRCFKFEFRSFQVLVFNRCSMTEHMGDSLYNDLIHTFFNWIFLLAQLVKNLPTM